VVVIGAAIAVSVNASAKSGDRVVESTTTTTTTSTALPSTTSTGPPTTPVPTTQSAQLTTTTIRPSTTTTTSLPRQFELTNNAPSTARTTDTRYITVQFRNLGPEPDGGYTLETNLVDATGKVVSATGTGGLMPTGSLVEDHLWVACAPLAPGAEVPAGSLALEGPCKPGVYRIEQIVSHNGRVVTRQFTATIRFT
jgi:hypothetical protein